MINIRAYNCHACTHELPELEKIGRDYSEKGGQIILVCMFADTPEGIGLSDDILKEKGCTLPCLATLPELEGTFPIPPLPMTFFVDSEGRILEEPIDEENPKLYIEYFDKHLGQ